MKKKKSAKKVMVEGQDAKELKELEYLHERLKKIWKDLFIELNEIRPITLDKLEEIMYYSSKKSELSVNVKIKLIEKFKIKLIEFYQFF